MIKTEQRQADLKPSSAENLPADVWFIRNSQWWIHRAHSSTRGLSVRFWVPPVSASWLWDVLWLPWWSTVPVSAALKACSAWRHGASASGWRWWCSSWTPPVSTAACLCPGKTSQSHVRPLQHSCKSSLCWTVDSGKVTLLWPSFITCFVWCYSATTKSCHKKKFDCEKFSVSHLSADVQANPSSSSSVPADWCSYHITVFELLLNII